MAPLLPNSSAVLYRKGAVTCRIVAQVLEIIPMCVVKHSHIPLSGANSHRASNVWSKSFKISSPIKYWEDLSSVANRQNHGKLLDNIVTCTQQTSHLYDPLLTRIFSCAGWWHCS